MEKFLPRKKKKILLFVLLSMTSFAFLLYATVVSILRHSDSYKQALDFIDHEATILETVGEPYNVGWMVTGSIEWTGAENRAHFSIPISGPKSSARVRVFLDKIGDTWQVQDAWLDPSDGHPSFPILQVAIREVTFHSVNEDGPVVSDQIYSLGETVFWNLLISNFSRQNGQIALQEGIKITDAAGQVILDDPALIVERREDPQGPLSFNNHVTLTDTGTFGIRVLITDLFSGRSQTWEGEVTVRKPEQFGITAIEFRHNSFEGELNIDRSYKENEDVYFNIFVGGVPIKDGHFSFEEDLFVFNQDGQLVFSHPQLLTLDDSADKADYLTLQNTLTGPPPGRYTIRVVLRDKTQELTIDKEANFAVIP